MSADASRTRFGHSSYDTSTMNLVWGLLITLGAAGIAIALMLVVRRRAPEGSYFADGDRASGVFGVIATGFSVFLGFIVFLAFTSYDQTRAGAETEARWSCSRSRPHNSSRTASGTLTGQLICYGRFVVHDEWPRMRAETIGTGSTRGASRCSARSETVDPKTATEQSAYDQWLGQTSQREQARLDRTHGAVGVIPTPLWFVLFFIAAIIFAYMLFFADRARGAVTQSMLMGAVVAVIDRAAPSARHPQPPVP